MLCVFVDEDAELHAKHLQRDVDDAFGVTVLDLESPSFFVGEGHYGCVKVVQNLHVDIEQVALKPQTCLRSGVEDIAIDLVLVYALCQEMTDELVDDRAV